MSIHNGFDVADACLPDQRHPAGDSGAPTDGEECLPGEGSYSFVPRPAAGQRDYPFLVFDEHGLLHGPLTLFAARALWHIAHSTVCGYLHALLRMFSYFAWGSRSEYAMALGCEPKPVRAGIRTYLVACLRCKALMAWLAALHHAHAHAAPDTWAAECQPHQLMALPVLRAVGSRLEVRTYAHKTLGLMSSLGYTAVAGMFSCLRAAGHVQRSVLPPACTVVSCEMRPAAPNGVARPDRVGVEGARARVLACEVAYRMRFQPRGARAGLASRRPLRIRVRR